MTPDGEAMRLRVQLETEALENVESRLHFAVSGKQKTRRGSLMRPLLGLSAPHTTNFPHPVCTTPLMTGLGNKDLDVEDSCLMAVLQLLVLRVRRSQETSDEWVNGVHVPRIPPVAVKRRVNCHPFAPHTSRPTYSNNNRTSSPTSSHHRAYRRPQTPATWALCGR
jgi:hypothetical protein